jgi:hypothetical protein
MDGVRLLAGPGLIASRDGGLGWTMIDEGLGASVRVHQLSLAGGGLHAATTPSVYDRQVGGGTPAAASE